MPNPKEHLSIPSGNTEKNVGVRIALWFPLNHITYIKPVLLNLVLLALEKEEHLKLMKNEEHPPSAN